MTATQITGGVVTVSERIKTGDFEHREAKAELRFDVAEGSGFQDVFDQATQAAQAQVKGVLTGKMVKLSNPRVRARLPDVANETTTSEPEVEAKAEVILAAVGGAMDIPDDPTSSSTGALSQPSSDPEASTSPSDIPEDWEAVQPEVTDKQMMDACAEANARLQREGADGKAPTMVKEVIYKYVPKGKVSRDIPQAQRRAFLADLDKLKGRCVMAPDELLALIAAPIYLERYKRGQASKTAMELAIQDAKALVDEARRLRDGGYEGSW